MACFFGVRVLDEEDQIGLMGRVLLCTDQADSAQARLLEHKPQQGFVYPVPGDASGCYRTNPVSNNSTGLLQGFKSMAVHTLVFQFDVDALHPFLPRSEKGLVFTSRSDTSLVKSYGLRKEVITSYTTPAANTQLNSFCLEQFWWSSGS